MIETVEFWLNDLIEGTSGLVIVLSMLAIFVIETVRLWIKRGLSKEYFAEEERPTYGLVQQINTQNPIKVWFCEIPALWRDVRGAPDWATALKYLTKPPGWSPKSDRAK